MTAMDFWFHSEMHGFKKPAKKSQISSENSSVQYSWKSKRG